MHLEGRAGAVARDDAGAFLPAMLQGEEPVVGQNGGVRMTEHAEEPALMLRKHGCFRQFDIRRC